MPPCLRGLSHAGIGIMESQHRKITYRMKKRGMYWSQCGCEIMAKLIVKVYDKSFRELFYGDWRQDYAYYKALEKQGVGSLAPDRKYNSHLHESSINLNQLVKKVAEKRFLV